MKLIDKDTVLDMLDAMMAHGKRLSDAFEAVKEMETVDAVPIRHGRWIADESMYTVGEAQCSVCKTTFYADDLYMVGEKAQSEMPNYCPHCGAKMDAEREKNE